MNRTKPVVVYPAPYGTAYHLSKEEFHVPQEKCARIVEDILEFITFNRSGAFQTDRHVKYPTTDVDVIKVLDNARGLRLTTLVYPLLQALRRYYNVPDNVDVVLADYFFAKYEPTAQNSLDRHTDGSLLSFVVSLSDPEDFVGGTMLLGENQTGAARHEVRLFQGDAVIFPGGVLAHAVTPVVSGRRFVLTGFVELQHQQRVPSIVLKEWCNRFQFEAQKAHDQGKTCRPIIESIPRDLQNIADQLPGRIISMGRTDASCESEVCSAAGAVEASGGAAAEASPGEETTPSSG